MSQPSTPSRKQESALRGGIWTTLSRVFVQLIQFAIFIVAVHLMRPEEFGLFALVAAFIVILNQLATAGWPEYIMQWHGDTYRARQTLFVSVVGGASVAALGIALSFLAPWFSDDPVVGPLARALSVTVFFTSIAAAYAGVLNWQNKLTSAALSALIGEIANLIVAVWALYEGYGVMALAYGRIASTFVWGLSGFMVSRLTPAIVTHPPLIKEMITFSWNIILTRLLGNLRVYAATFVIGGFVGAAAVGYYRAGQRIIGAFEEIVGEPARLLAWNMFRKSRDNDGGINGYDTLSRDFFQTLNYGTVPLFVGIAILAPELAVGVLGPEWLPAVPVMQILAFASLIRVSGHTTVPILTLTGHAKLLPRYTLLFTIITVACIMVGAVFGIVATAWSEVIAAAIVFVISARFMRRHANIHWSVILTRSWPVIPALAAALLPVFLAKGFDWLDGVHPLARFFLLGLSMIVVFVPTILFLDRPLLARLSRAVSARH